MLDDGLKFLKLLREFEQVQRVIYRPDDRRENDVEHSYQVAMMAWFFSDQFNLGLNLEKLLKYSLVHDLVEVHAGDTPVYGPHGNSIHKKETKKEREENALISIKNDFKNFSAMTEAIESYERRSDEESIFVYELDKVIPLLNLYMDGGYGWKKLGSSLEQIKQEKRSKVKSVQQLVVLLEESLSRMDRDEKILFGKAVC